VHFASFDYPNSLWRWIEAHKVGSTSDSKSKEYKKALAFFGNSIENLEFVEQGKFSLIFFIGAQWPLIRTAPWLEFKKYSKINRTLNQLPQCFVKLDYPWLLFEQPQSIPYQEISSTVGGRYKSKLLLYLIHQLFVLRIHLRSTGSKFASDA